MEAAKAREAIDGLLVAEIIHDAQSEFRGQYDPEVFSLGVGPIQSMLGLAVMRGHIVVPVKDDVINVGPVLEIGVALGFALVLFCSIGLGIAVALWKNGLL